LTAIGASVDYSMAAGMKAKLQSAADAAGVASILAKSAGYIAATTMVSNGPVPAGVTAAPGCLEKAMIESESGFIAAPGEMS
jgi:hypothetical protein